jgi:hypothetical protein
MLLVLVLVRVLAPDRGVSVSEVCAPPKERAPPPVEPALAEEENGDAAVVLSPQVFGTWRGEPGGAASSRPGFNCAG